MSRSPEELQADVERQRQQLADTVDALAAKADVRARMTTATGRPRPELLTAVAVAVVAAVVVVVWKRRR